MLNSAFLRRSMFILILLGIPMYLVKWYTDAPVRVNIIDHIWIVCVVAIALYEADILIPFLLTAGYVFTLGQTENYLVLAVSNLLYLAYRGHALWTRQPTST